MTGRPQSPRQPDAPLPEILPAALVVRHDPAEGLPVVAVAAGPQVHQFVDDDVAATWSS